MTTDPTNAKANSLLEKTLSLRMDNCAAKLSKLSAGKWRVTGVNAQWRTVDEVLSGRGATPGVRTVVYFEVRGEYPFTAMVVFRPDDIALISRAYPGGSSPRVQALRQTPEILFSELGNVILNSFIGALFDALSGSFLPTAPKCVRGEPQYLLEAVWMTLDPKLQHNVAIVTLGLNCDGAEAHIEVIAVISESLENALILAEKK